MNRHAIWHETGSSYSYPLSRKKLFVMLRAQKNDLTGVNCYYYQRFDGPDFDQNMKKYENSIRMKKTHSDHLFDYFTVEIDCDRLGIVYFFETFSEKESCFYGHFRFFNQKPVSDLDMYMFNSLPERDVLTVPQWSKGAVIYQVFTSSFNGGTLKGVAEKLQHIKELGADVIYFTPIFESESPHKYDTIDYYNISKDFGKNADFKNLTLKAHNLGMKVVLDGVFNHVSDNFPQFVDARTKGEKSRYWKWFDIDSIPVSTSFKPNYSTFGNYGNMPKAMTANPEVADFFCDVAKYWIDKYNADGWRIDCANEIDHHFHRKLRDEIKTAKDDALIISEIWHESSDWLEGDQYDGTMNYQFYRSIEELITEGSITADEFLDRVSFICAKYKNDALLASWNLIDSHDTPRFLTQQKKSIKKFKAGVLLQFILPGSPFIYYGDEIGMEGGADPDNRRNFNWDISTWNHDILTFYKKLINLRIKYRSLKTGIFSRNNDCECKDVLTFSRILDDEKVDLFINAGFQEREITLPEGEIIFDSFSESITADEQRTVLFQPYDYAVINRK